MSDSSFSCFFENILFPSTRKPEQPKDRVGDSLENINPNIKDAWVNFVKLIETSKDKFILRTRSDNGRGVRVQGDKTDLFDSILSSAHSAVVIENETCRLFVVIDETGVRHQDELFVIIGSEFWKNHCLVCHKVVHESGSHGSGEPQHGDLSESHRILREQQT